MEVKCPQCGKKTLFAPENPFRPFCSESCRIIDLGEWASESYRIPVVKDSAMNGEELEDDLDHENESEADS